MPYEETSGDGLLDTTFWIMVDKEQDRIVRLERFVKFRNFFFNRDGPVTKTHSFLKEGVESLY